MTVHVLGVVAGPEPGGRTATAVDGVLAGAAKAGAGSEVLELPCGHFDIYSGEMFERSAAAQVGFLTRTLAVTAAA